MVESMRHETYYGGDRYINSDLGLYMGWLSHPCSLGHRMPLISRDKQVVLIILGEICFDCSRSVENKDDGAYETDAQHLLRLYEDAPDKFVGNLNGWFCGIAIDLRLGKATLFNDRYGMSRVYLYEAKDELIFASEAKALLRVRPALRAIDPTSLAQYLRFNCVMGNMTLFKEVSLLPAASSWVFAGDAAPQKKRYFDFGDWEVQSALKPDEFVEKFDETVFEVVSSCMRDPSRVALSLTSGLDTRVILASADKRRSPASCYTFGGLWGETFDIQIARKLAAICEQPHEVIRLNEQFLKNFPVYAKKSVYVSDGTHDAFGAHDVYFNQIAHDIAPIRLTGKFGSEVVRVRKLIHLAEFPRNLLQAWFIPFVDEASSYRIGKNLFHPLSRVLSEEIPRAEFGRVAVEQSKVILRTPYMDNRLVKLMYQAPVGLRGSRDLQVDYITKRNQQLANLPTDMGIVGKETEPIPILSHYLFWALAKSEYIYLYSMPHWLTCVDRKLEKLRLERFIVGRQKFEAYRIWLKTHFADFVRAVLLSPSTRCTEFFDKIWLERVVRRHTGGTHNYQYEINKILTVELIYSSLLQPS